MTVLTVAQWAVHLYTGVEEIILTHKKVIMMGQDMAAAALAATLHQGMKKAVTDQQG